MFPPSQIIEGGCSYAYDESTESYCCHFAVGSHFKFDVQVFLCGGQGTVRRERDCLNNFTFP